MCAYKVWHFNTMYLQLPLLPAITVARFMVDFSSSSSSFSGHLLQMMPLYTVICVRLSWKLVCDLFRQKHKRRKNQWQLLRVCKAQFIGWSIHKLMFGLSGQRFWCSPLSQFPFPIQNSCDNYYYLELRVSICKFFSFPNKHDHLTGAIVLV